MQKITITNEQKGAKWTEKTVNLPETFQEYLDMGGTETGLFTLFTRAFPVVFRQTDGSQEAVVSVLATGASGDGTGGGKIKLESTRIQKQIDIQQAAIVAKINSGVTDGLAELAAEVKKLQKELIEAKKAEKK